MSKITYRSAHFDNVPLKSGSIKQVVKLLKSNKYNNSALYEYITKNTNEYIRPYFDVDYKAEDCSTDFDNIMDNKECQILEPAKQYICSLLNVNDTDLAISESDYDNKISYHIIVNRAIKYEDMVELKKTNSNDFKSHHIDIAPYGKTAQHFRMVNTSKDKMNSPLIPITYAEELERHIISYITDDMEKFELEHTVEAEILQLMDEEIESTSMPKPVIVQTIQTVIEPSTVYELVKLLSHDRAHKFHTWIRVGYCLFNIDEKHFPIWDEFSRTSSKYKDGECFELWNNKFEKRNLTLATLHYWAKQDNPKQYAILMATQNDNEKLNNCLSGLDRDIADFAVELFKYDWVFSNKCWFHFDGVRWKKFEKSFELMVEFSRITKILINYKNTCAEKWAKILEDARDKDKDGLEKKQENEMDAIMKVIKKCKSTQTQENIIKQMAGLLTDADFESKLNVNPYLLGFDDGVFDLINNEFRQAEPKDMISRSCKHNYADLSNITEKDKLLFDKAFGQIFPEQTLRQYIIDLYSACLNGNAPQIFNINAGHNNTGGNGKGLLKRWMMKALGEYATEFNVSLLTQSRNKSSSASPELAKLQGARFAICAEPEQNSQLNGAMIKEMTGGDQIQCRALHSNDNSFKAQFTLFIECNKKPAVDLEDGGITRRFRVCEFPSTFTDNKSLINNVNIFPMDDTLYSEEIVLQYSKVWLVMLLENHAKLMKVKQHITVPKIDIITQTTLRYFSETNAFINFLDENIEQCEINDGITMKEMYGAFISTEDYKNSSKRARMSKKECIEALLKSPYGKYYHHADAKEITKNHPKTRNSNTLGFYKFVDDYETVSPLDA